MKIIRNPGDEWRSGEILDAFAAHGTVRVYDHGKGALLIERLTPGTPLTSVLDTCNDEEATRILADVIARMSPRAPPDAVPGVQQWGRAFDRYRASGHIAVPTHLLLEAQRIYAELCASQVCPRLLHGDLHHSNVLFDRERGWLAIDPKGVVGELEYEVGAALRNPYERPELFTARRTIEQRVECFARALNLNPARILAWGFAQAVLSAVWAVEDGVAVAPGHGWLVLARAIRPLLSDIRVSKR